MKTLLKIAWTLFTATATVAGTFLASVSILQIRAERDAQAAHDKQLAECERIAELAGYRARTLEAALSEANYECEKMRRSADAVFASYVCVYTPSECPRLRKTNPRKK